MCPTSLHKEKRCVSFVADRSVSNILWLLGPEKYYKKYVDKSGKVCYYTQALRENPFGRRIWASGGIGRLARFRF